MIVYDVLGVRFVEQLVFLLLLQSHHVVLVLGAHPFVVRLLHRVLVVHVVLDLDVWVLQSPVPAGLDIEKIELLITFYQYGEKEKRLWGSG